MKQRDSAVERFLTNDDVAVLIATPQSSKEGLTLTTANHVIFFDRSFSLDDYIQAQDRIHRISQDKTCFVYNLIMDNSIEGWVDLLLATKQAAASLGQQDIDREEYQRVIRYDLAGELRSVLNMD
jgi:SNF2 family DNA or RNA helicase